MQDIVIRLRYGAGALFQYTQFRAALSSEDLAAHDAETKVAIPLGGKFGEADRDLAPVMVFLASDASHFMTNQLFPVDGGLISLR